MHPIPSLLLITALLVNTLLPGKAQPVAYPYRSPQESARPAQDAEPQAEAIADRPRIRLAVELAETKEGKTVAVAWLVEGWDSLAEQSDLELVLALPKALTPLEAEYLQSGESPGTWRLALKEAAYSQSGQNVQEWTYASGGQGWVQRGSYPVTLANGDQLGAAVTSGGQVRVYRNGVLLTTVDVSGWPYYQGGGYIGV